MDDTPKFTGFPDACPLAGAEPAAGIVYRITKNNPPNPSDFLSVHESGRILRGANADAICMSHGLSVFREISHAQHKRNLFPKLGQFVAWTELSPTSGVAKATGEPTHTTWWCYDGVVRHLGFVTLEE